ncbi:MAG: fibrobacter succinogenes major paralogous domain-containing protein [Flavobacteriales bacterium]|nr:fibrobacter succinogenes major paralogous domain-containing protein [Flavobacteriales bacterium]
MIFSTAVLCTVNCMAQSCVDIDGNSYDVVTIGGQTWMAEDLKTTRFRNGTAIPTGYTNIQWGTAPAAFAYPNDDPSLDALYGKLYNFKAVVHPYGLCPAGWHMPTSQDITTLYNYLGSSQTAGAELKDTVTWCPSNVSTNSTGFSALAAGGRTPAGTYAPPGGSAIFWCTSTSTDGTAPAYEMIRINPILALLYLTDKDSGCSIRCLADAAQGVSDQDPDDGLIQLVRSGPDGAAEFNVTQGVLRTRCSTGRPGPHRGQFSPGANTVDLSGMVFWGVFPRRRRTLQVRFQVDPVGPDEA